MIYAISNSNPPNLCMRAEMKPLIHATGGESTTKSSKRMRFPVEGDADEDPLAKLSLGIAAVVPSGSLHLGTLGGTALVSQN